MKPFVGLPATGFGCTYSADIDQGCCDAVPTVHILSDAPGWGVVALASCAPHAPFARAAGVVMIEHEYARACDTQECWHG